MQPLIDIRDLVKTYPAFRLEIPSFRLEAGTILGLIGPNGAGKSTLIKILMGMVRADAGDVRVLGLRVPAREREVKARVGFLSEEMSLYDGLTVDWHVRFVASCFPGWDADYAARLFGRFGLDPKSKVGALSRGTRVKLQLLLAMARRPPLLLLDEPTSGLDPVVRQELLEEMMQVVLEEEHAVLFSSHITTDVERCADRVAFLRDGRILEEANKDDLLDRWRVLRFTAQACFEPDERDAIVRAEWRGASASWTTERFTKDLLADLARRGGRDVSVDRMTLEEIFLTRMQQPRTQGASR